MREDKKKNNIDKIYQIEIFELALQRNATKEKDIHMIKKISLSILISL